MTHRHPGVSIIVAVDNNNAIGRAGDLLYHISADLRNFRRLTTGNIVVMGRRTFESLPKGALPDRVNMVITRNKAYQAKNVELCVSLEGALVAARTKFPERETFIIGGGEIYRQAFPIADKLYLTCVDAATDGADTFFPEIDPKEWQTEEAGEWLTDEKSGLRYRFVCLSRK